MLIAALVVFLLGGSDPAYGPVTELLADSESRVSEVATDRSHRRQIQSAMEDVLTTYEEQVEDLEKAKIELKSVVRSHDATPAELASAIDRYQDQEAKSQQAWLDAYFDLRATMNAEQWEALQAVNE